MMTTKEIVLKHLLDLRLVSSEHDGYRWLTEEKILSFGGKTATELITEGRADACTRAHQTDS